ncbi:MAG: hypothetical protein JSR45_00810 [Proteobacteria bacterium]|nr:hypothetical protein [Pseudomonadota bacterium]
MSMNRPTDEELQAFREALSELTAHDQAVILAMLQHIRVLALSHGEAVAEAALARVIAVLIAPAPPSRGLQEAPQPFVHASPAAMGATAAP